MKFLDQVKIYIKAGNANIKFAIIKYKNSILNLQKLKNLKMKNIENKAKLRLKQDAIAYQKTHATEYLNLLLFLKLI